MNKLCFAALGFCLLASAVQTAPNSGILNPGILAEIFTGGSAKAVIVPGYSCAGKADGDYYHPTDCSKFVTCVGQTYAYEQSCAPCPGNPRCPNGILHFNQDQDECLFPDEQQCVIDSQQGRK